jgi:hypothetical protein
MSGLPEAKGTTVSHFATHAGEPGVIYAANPASHVLHGCQESFTPPQAF